jgi:hypothetical protein
MQASNNTDPVRNPGRKKMSFAERKPFKKNGNEMLSA